MNDVQLLYHDLAAIYKREKFDPDCSITLENFQSLIAEVHIKSQLICQFEKDGSRCNNRFNSGWLTRRSDGAEGLIGCDCGNQYLQASETFGRERNRLNLELRIAGHIAALTNYLANRDGFLARWGRANQGLLATRSIMRELENGLPSEVVSTLRDMAKRRDRSIYVEVKRVEIETDNQGNEKERTYWDRRDVGNVAGLDAWNPEAALFLFKKLEEIKDALYSMNVEHGHKESVLRKWRETLDELPHCEEVLAGYERAVADFFSQENFKLLCHLVWSEEYKMDIARLILRRGRDSAPSNTSMRAFVNQAQASVRQQYGGKDFRVAY